MRLYLWTLLTFRENYIYASAELPESLIIHVEWLTYLQKFPSWSREVSGIGD